MSAGLDPLLALAAAPVVNSLALGCPFVRAMDALDEDDPRRAALRHLVDVSKHSAVKVARACQETGIDLSDNQIQRHRNRTGSCKCPA